MSRGEGKEGPQERVITPALNPCENRRHDYAPAAPHIAVSLWLTGPSIQKSSAPLAQHIAVSLWLTGPSIQKRFRASGAAHSGKPLAYRTEYSKFRASGAAHSGKPLAYRTEYSKKFRAFGAAHSGKPLAYRTEYSKKIPRQGRSYFHRFEPSMSLVKSATILSATYRGCPT